MKRPEELAFKRLCNEEEKEKDKTEQTMESGNVLILTGEPGTGKTSTGEEMLRRLSQLNEKTSGYIPIILNVPEDLRLVFEYDKRVAVLVDDPFGKSSCDYQKLEQWERYLRDIEVQVDGGKLKIIFCIRKQTLSESEEITQKYDLFHANNIVDLSSKDNKLSNKEKRYLLIKFCRLNDVTICKELEKQNLPEKIIASLTIGYIAGSDPMLGFQQACYLFFTKPEFFIRGVDFFKHASVNLKLEIDKLRGTKPLQYCILAYAMLKGGFIDVSNIDQSMFEKLFEILEAEAKHSRDIIHSVIHDMDKRYLIRISHGKEVFEFKHETILEAILLSFGNNFSQEFLKLGAKKIITGFARSHGYEPEPGEIYVAFSASDHVQLANYLAQQYGMASIAQHPTSNDKMFIPVLLEIIEKYQQKHLYQRSLLVQRSIEKTDDFTALERIDHQNMAVINAVKYKRTNLVIEMLKRYMHQKGRQDKADSSNSQNFQFQILTVSTYIHALNYLFQNGSQNGAEEVMEVVGVSLEPALRLLQHEIKTKLKCTNICWYAAYCEWRFVLLQLHSSLPDTKFDDKYDEPLIDYCSKLGWIDVVETLLTIKNDDLNQKNPHMENTGVRAASRFNY